VNTSDNTDHTNLADAPTMRAATEGLMAIPTCATPACDRETEPFTDRCPDCLTGGPSPLGFPFERYDNAPGEQMERDFAEVHPGAHYVVLRVNNPRELARLLDDLSSHPGCPLLTPVQEHAVNAVAVATIRTLP
jgi:hypothetical protein